MPTGPVSGALDHLRRAALRAGAGPGDGELLGRFVDRGDADALAALVGRHAPMVWGVCRRALGHHDAEDAFQATFLVLARKAAAVAPREAVGNWLYGVAHRTALLARRTAARRRAREVQLPTLPDPAAPPDRGFDAALLDAELCRLPDIYRTVLVLCELEGRTRAEAARTLGVPEGTVAGRLVRARALLARRLAARGVAPAAVLVTLAPTPVAGTTIDAAARVAAGQAATPAAVAALTTGVTNAMRFTTLRAAAAAVLTLGLVAAAASTQPGRPTPPRDDAKPTATKAAEPPPVPKKDEEVVAWGRRIGGLQAGLVLRGGARKIYRLGDTITLGVRVRNVGKEAVTFGYVRQHLDEHPPTVTDPDGATIEQPLISVLGVAHPATQVTLEPGKAVELESRFTGPAGRRYELVSSEKRAAGRESRDRALFVTQGTIGLQVERVFGDSSIGKAEVAPALRRLGTGVLEIEVEPAVPPKE